jgi:hypothetical protein
MSERIRVRTRDILIATTWFAISGGIVSWYDQASNRLGFYGFMLLLDVGLSLAPAAGVGALLGRPWIGPACGCASMAAIVGFQART